MKFIHLGDVHLGVKPDLGFPWSKEREQEVFESFRNIIDICNEKKVDLLLIAGDFFHKQPLIRELKEVDYIFSRLIKTKVIIIAGNHDYISSRSNYIKFEWGKNVHMLINEHMDSIYLEEINTEVYGFSYHKREIKEALLDHVKIHNRDRINILLAHGGTPTNIPFNLKILKSKGFDYIALGHIHKPEKLGKRIAYAGSIEPTDKNDIGARGYIIGEIEKEDKDFESAISFSFAWNSIRQYINLDIEISDSTTNGALLDLIRERMSTYKSKNIFIINIRGYKDPDIKFDLDSIKKLGNIIEVKDKSIANYDFNQLYKENENNIIGSFISSIEKDNNIDDVKTKALYYGIEALIHAKN